MRKRIREFQQKPVYSSENVNLTFQVSVNNKISKAKINFNNNQNFFKTWKQSKSQSAQF